MIFRNRVSCGNTVKHIEFIQCFRVSVFSPNRGRLTRCILSVFPCFKCFPLKGAAGGELATSPFGDGRCV